MEFINDFDLQIVDGPLFHEKINHEGEESYHFNQHNDEKKDTNNFTTQIDIQTEQPPLLAEIFPSAYKWLKTKLKEDLRSGCKEAMAIFQVLKPLLQGTNCVPDVLILIQNSNLNQGTKESSAKNKLREQSDNFYHITLRRLKDKIELDSQNQEKQGRILKIQRLFELLQRMKSFKQDAPKGKILSIKEFYPFFKIGESIEQGKNSVWTDFKQYIIEFYKQQQSNGSKIFKGDCEMTVNFLENINSYRASNKGRGNYSQEQLSQLEIALKNIFCDDEEGTVAFQTPVLRTKKKIRKWKIKVSQESQLQVNEDTCMQQIKTPLRTNKLVSECGSPRSEEIGWNQYSKLSHFRYKPQSPQSRYQCEESSFIGACCYEDDQGSAWFK